MEKLVEILHQGGYSCVIRKGEEVRTFTERGISDLYTLLRSPEHFLQNAEIADKVIGKAAASLMAVGGVSQIYADVISEAACNVLKSMNIPFQYTTLTPYIKRRDLQGMCPMEALTLDAASAQEAVERIIQKLSAPKD